MTAIFTSDFVAHRCKNKVKNDIFCFQSKPKKYCKFSLQIGPHMKLHSGFSPKKKKAWFIKRNITGTKQKQVQSSKSEGQQSSQSSHIHFKNSKK